MNAVVATYRSKGLRAMTLIVVFVAISVGASRVGAHPISMSAVAVNVEKGQVMANMKVMLEDLVMYYGLQAGPDQRFSFEDLQRAAEKHQAFVLQYFTIHNEAGRRLSGDVLRLDRRDIPTDGTLPAELMARNVFYHLVFPLAQEQEFLTFTQTFGGEGAVLPAVMELVLFQNRAPLQQPVQLMQGQPHTVRFDWDHPPTQASQSVLDYHQKKQEAFRDQLGITSYSGLYSFIYITAQEVRHEILIPLLTLEKWLPVGRANPDFIDVPEQVAAREKIATFFRDRNPVVIDGIAVKPVLSKLQFFGLNINDFARHAQPQRVSVYQARVGLILSYATKGAPSHVQMTWETFNTHAPFVRSMVYIHDNAPKLHIFKTDSPRFTWTSAGEVPTPTLLQAPKPKRAPMWSLPLFSIAASLGAIVWGGISLRQWQSLSLSRVLLGMVPLLILGLLCWPMGRVEVRSPFARVPQLSDVEARDLTLALLRNIYRAFDYKSESDVYDALARSVDGQFLNDLYLQVQKGLQMQEQGGAIARVREVKLVDNHIVTSQLKSDGRPQLQVQCRWQVTGTVEHWGHIHTRENAYKAELTLRTQAEAWKITDYELLDEQRVRFETGLRTSKRSG